MKKIILIIVVAVWALTARGQSNNPLSIYEDERISTITFKYDNLPPDSLLSLDLRTKIEGAFRIFPQTAFNSFLADYYAAQIRLMAGVEQVVLNIEPTTAGEIDLILRVTLSPSTATEVAKRQSMFADIKSFPTLFSSPRTFLTLKFAASQMAYSNNNSWFARPDIATSGNPLATSPSGAGYTGWVEGFAAAGVYGITKIVPSINLHIYGGVNYLASFSAGAELFTNKSRFYGDLEEAYIGIIGGGRTKSGHNYRYNILYGRKQFVLGEGWLIINTSMNGDNRAALQLNPRWASKGVFQAGFMYDRLFLQIFSLQPNELPILNSKTLIQGVNFELGSNDRFLIGATYLNIPRSNFKYYLPSGDVRTRAGLQVVNLRIFKNAVDADGLFFKAEGGYQWNPKADMSAFAFYGEVGWTFKNTATTPTISYRYAYFSGDDPNSKSYNRWDALYTGGTGEQWVQGVNMYKMVQNSNEQTHRIQATINPIRKMQVVGQLWLFYAPQTLNLGGNPALSVISSKFYGAEVNVTLKYFQSQNWYFHLAAGYTFPGSAIQNSMPYSKDWFSLMAFARYSF